MIVCKTLYDKFLVTVSNIINKIHRTRSKNKIWINKIQIKFRPEVI